MLAIVYGDIREFEDGLELTDPESLYKNAYDKVSTYRRNKVDRFRFAEDKKRSLLAGLLLNHLTAAWMRGELDGTRKDLCEGDMEINWNFDGAELLTKITIPDLINGYDSGFDYEIVTIEEGKPVFKNHNELHFSISHSGNYSICAISDIPVGVDIEGYRDFDDTLIGQIGTAEETAWVRAAENAENMQKRALKLWVLKEAYGKAAGCGVYKILKTQRVIEVETGCPDTAYEDMKMCRNQAWNLKEDEDMMVGICLVSQK